MATSVHRDSFAPDGTGPSRGERHPDALPIASPSTALRWLDLRLAQAVADFRDGFAREAAGEPFRGLFIGDDEVERLMALQPGGSPLQASGSLPVPADDWPELAALRARYGLSPFDTGVLLIAAAPDLDLRYERLFSFLQDDVSKKRPTVDLALNLLTATPAEKLEGRRHFRGAAPLVRHHLIELVAEPTSGSLLAHYLRIDPCVVDRLLGHSHPDPRLARCCRLATPARSLADTAVPPRQLRELQDCLERLAPAAGPRPIVMLCGTRGSGRFAVLESAAYAQGKPVFTLFWDQVVQDPVMAGPGFAAQVLREAERARALLHIRIETSPVDRPALDALLSAACDYDGAIVISAPGPLPYWQHGPSGARVLLHTIEFSKSDAVMREAVLKAELAERRLALDDAVRQRFTDRFVLSTEQIATVVQRAAAARALAGDAAQHGAAVGYAELAVHAKAMGQDRLCELAVRIVPKYRWADLVVPEATERQLRELLGRILHRRRVMYELGFAEKLSLGLGTTALFAGSSGVGKTMAAEVLAHEVGLELFKVDLSTVVSKYIGETSKNLSTLFDAAADANCILFLDEADAVCGKRGSVRDAQDRYANAEISHLLQKIEEYDGIVLLASNLPQNFDEAFSRRITSKVFFPFPDAAARERIWRAVLPDRVATEPDVDWAVWARAFELSGGNIKNIALCATFLAAAEGGGVGNRQLLCGLQREYEKLGRWISSDELWQQFEAQR